MSRTPFHEGGKFHEVSQPPRRIFNCGVEVKRGYFVAQKRTSNN